jgi:predicted GNAT family N-acyltransferase
MAVLKEARGQGYGARLLQALLLEARRRGNKEARLSAQRTAEHFYAAHGFVVDGDPFDEVGIAHIEMCLSLVK